jgi:hypothetical protein
MVFEYWDVPKYGFWQNTGISKELHCRALGICGTENWRISNKISLVYVLFNCIFE